ncbi:AaceriADL348Wp [[Ashbya] aceris (nom. inval.)]|nr:AaceriADL348Wp [[Ashbya] aceris (nom. inval.)]
MKLNKLVLGSVLWAHALADESQQAAEPHKSANFCKIDKDQQVGSTCDITFHELNEINDQIRPQLAELVKTDFFRYFKLDLYKECPFWSDNNGYCVNRACAVDVVEDWESVPDIWQPEVLGGLDEDSVKSEGGESDECSFLNELCGRRRELARVEPVSIDYCDVTDFMNKDSVLVDLVANPERFTGYGGEQSAQIWSAIYKENCFTLGEHGFCLAKDVFYRLISGLHASIATHLSNDYLDTKTGKWGPNLELFMARVGNFPDRVANIYFNFAIIAKALWKIQPYLERVEFCNVYDTNVKHMITDVVSRLDSRIFNEDLLFQDDISMRMKDDFRRRFKNVTKIMDCVHCDRCRMWGKVQTTGYATSLKILFEMDAGDERARQRVVDKLTKYELIALFNTFDRISKSVSAINNFERVYRNEAETNTSSIAAFFQNNFFRLLGRSSAPGEREASNVTEDTSLPVDTTPADEPYFADIKMPVRPAKPENTQESMSDLHMELRNVCHALHFIWRSYVELPRNLMILILNAVNTWFNNFIGVPT